jgi:hypothetical protein
VVSEQFGANLVPTFQPAFAIFLTGATGFVGHHVAKALAAEGADLRFLVRKTSKLSNLEGIRGETHVGDLAQPETLRPALEDCDAVVHVAADYRLWIPDPAAMYRANVDGTRELLRMAREAGVPRFVYTSSVATMHFRTDGIVINEDTPVSLAESSGGWAAGDYPEPDHAHWAQRCEADAHRANFRRFPQRQISGLRRHGAQPCGCGRSGAHACFGADQG